MKNCILLDGAMGTELMKRGCAGSFPEEANLTAPEAVREIHGAYRAAGSRILYACTFGANPVKARGRALRPVLDAALLNARTAAGTEARTALDVGPLGRLLEPLGELTEEEAVSAYSEIFAAAGAADLIVLETFFDLRELTLALETAKRLSDRPVFATMTFQKNGHTMTGVTVTEAARTLQAAGADAVGLNCSLGPAELLPLVRELRGATDLPLIVKPNAGMPDPAGNYPLGAEAFADAMLPILECGVDYAGGCCGTSPDYIRALAERL